ncbi:MAG: 4Fe-4S binding protein [Oscillospiraceae bacterium]|nr:4Fe-4S binding protein [Oscillospiraceae bacterium]
MKRQIIEIDDEKCVGCGLCTSTCQEGAIELVEGKAKLVREDHCDGLGNCLPGCPMEAISFIEKDFDEYNMMEHDESEQEKPAVLACGCPSSNSQSFQRDESETVQFENERVQVQTMVATQLKQWPVQIKLASPNAPYFQGAKLLIAADCSAYAYGNFHNDYMKNKVTLIGCPKLDEGDYSQSLTDILKMNDIKSVTIVRMEVPCCGGLEQATKNALRDCGKLIPWEVVTISTKGEILED